MIVSISIKDYDCFYSIATLFIKDPVIALEAVWAKFLRAFYTGYG